MLFAAGPPLAPIIIPAAAVVAVGAVGAITSLGTTRAQNAHALTMARDLHDRDGAARARERVEQRRADVYCDLLIDIHRQRLLVRQIAAALEDGRDPDIPMPPASDDPDRLSLAARVAAFGSEEVAAIWSEWVQTFIHIILAAVEDDDESAGAAGEDVERPTKLDKDVAVACRAVCGRVDDIERRIREELQGGVHTAPAAGG